MKKFKINCFVKSSPFVSVPLELEIEAESLKDFWWKFCNPKDHGFVLDDKKPWELTEIKEESETEKNEDPWK